MLTPDPDLARLFQGFYKYAFPLLSLPLLSYLSILTPPPYRFMKIMKYNTVNPYIDDDHVHPVSTATKAALASAGLAIDEKTGAVMSAGMSRGGESCPFSFLDAQLVADGTTTLVRRVGTAMSRLGNRSAIGGAAPVPEGTGALSPSLFSLLSFIPCRN
jgi:hypothetical protein